MATNDQIVSFIKGLPKEQQSKLGSLDSSQRQKFVELVGQKIDGMSSSSSSPDSKTVIVDEPSIGEKVLGALDAYGRAGASNAVGMANGVTAGLARPAIRAVTGQDIGEGSMLGRVVGSVAPAGLAGRGVGLLAKGANPIVRGALKLAGEGAVTTLGATPEESFKKYLETAPSKIVGGAGANVAIGGLLQGAGKVYNAIPNNAKKFASRQINSLIGTARNKFMYGKNAGEAIVDEGITANSLDELSAKVKQSKEKIWDEVQQKTSSSNAKIDLTGAEKPLDDLLVRLKKSPNTNSAIIKRVEGAKDDLLGIVRDKDGTILSQRDLTKLSPSEVMDLKQQIGDITKFSKDTITDDNLINGALKKIYGNAKAKLDSAVSGISDLTKRYASLIDADVSITNKIRANESKPIVPLAQRIAGAGVGAVMGMGSGGLGTALGGALGLASELGLEKALGSTTAKTRFAQWLANNLAKSPRANFDGARALARFGTGAGASLVRQK